MQRPPGLAPDSLDLIRLLAAEQFSDFALQDRADSGAISSCGVRVAHAFGAFGVGELDRIEFKSAHHTVRAVGEHDREWNAIKTAFYRGEIGHGVLLCMVAGRQEDCRRWAGRAVFDANAAPSDPTLAPAPALPHQPRAVRFEDRIDCLLGRGWHTILTAKRDHLSRQPVQFKGPARLEVVRH
jgi:hypothetical protein